MYASARARTCVCVKHRYIIIIMAMHILILSYGPVIIVAKSVILYMLGLAVLCNRTCLAHAWSSSSVQYDVWYILA